MNHFRSWSRRAWVLHGYLIATLALVPLQPVNSTWTDGDADGSNETWTTSEGVSYSLSQLDAIDIDVDHDGAYNEEELAAGSDPFLYDTDDDGLNDGDEIHLANQQGGRGYSLTSWDSNGDGVSDHDDFYGCFSVTYPNGELPGFSGAKYFDYDGDGIKNPLDLYPADPLNNDADGDGIDDSTDPAPGDPYNTSSANGQQWGSSALGDDDYDSILNFYDAWPSDSANGNNDSDGDGYDNGSDPFPSDYSNYSSANAIYWYGDLFGDSDSDGVPNYNDSWPYDSSNGASNTSNDDDGDGITNDLDPAPSDYDNNSPHNNTAWSWYPLEDADNDGQSNFYDLFPYDQYDNQPDFDGDGWPNESDPFPRDNSNYSEVNSTAWQTALFEDPDGDGSPNWQDPYPSDFYNGDTDYDDDGIVNESDPFPTDGTNYSEFNQTTWGTNVLGDDDTDGVPNWEDTTPSGNGTATTDSDGDTLDDSIDPAPSDNTNYSSVNGQSWYGEVFSDEDGDGTLNFWDQWIGDPYNGYPPTYDTDGDGFSDDVDPARWDYSNYSWYNYTYWYSDALNDADNDGIANFYDYQPNGDSNVDSDGDGYYDSNDPAPNDYTNYSDVNHLQWNNDALGDADSDDTLNFFDDTPYLGCPPPDYDQDDLNEFDEQSWGTSDNDTDSDDDGLPDGEEVHVHNSHPANAYSLSQERGWGNLYTDAQLVDSSDSDDDGIPNIIELHYGLNPIWAADALLDRDNDGTNNISQYQAGIALDAHLSSYDADDDGMTDVFEDAHAQVLSKINPDDAVEDADNDGVLNYEEQILLISPMNADTLQLGGRGDLQWLMLCVRYPSGGDPPTDDTTPANGIPDWADAVVSTPSAPDHYHFSRVPTANENDPADLDGDGMPDAWEHQYGRWKFQTNGLQLRFDDANDDADDDGLTNLFEYWIGTSPLADDTDGDSITDDGEDFDGDGLTNGFESRYGLSVYWADGEYDHDWDGLSNLVEQMLGLNPTSNDSDGDGIPDGEEDADMDGLTNLLEHWMGLSSISPDSDGDGVLDWDEDTDMDGVSNGMELTDNDPLTDPADSCNGVDPYFENINDDVGGQLVLRGALAAVPMKFKINRWNETTANYEPWANLPVAFEVLAGQGGIEYETGVDAGTKLTAFTDTEGFVTMHFRGAAVKDASKVNVTLLRFRPGLGAHSQMFDFWTSQCAVDADDDGMDDVWEAGIIAASGGLFASIADVRPVDDFDRDGVPNVFEFDRGTDPTNPAVFPDADVILDHTGAAQGGVPVVQTWVAAIEAAALAGYGDHPESRSIVKIMPGTYDTYDSQQYYSPSITKSVLLWGQGNAVGGVPVLTSTNSYGGAIVSAWLFQPARRALLMAQGLVLDGGGESNVQGMDLYGDYSWAEELSTFVLPSLVLENCIVRNCSTGGVSMGNFNAKVAFTTITGCCDQNSYPGNGITLNNSRLEVTNSILWNQNARQEVDVSWNSTFSTQKSALGANPGITTEGRLQPGAHVWNLLAEGSAPPVDIDGEQRAPLTMIGADQISDSDGDGVPDALEVTQGTFVFMADSDGDGVNDLADPLPLDPAVSSLSGLVSVPGPPVVQLISPYGAALVP